MPELPEVEALVCMLADSVVGSSIEHAWFDWPRTIRGVSPEQFNGVVSGRKIEAVSRRGKYVVLRLRGKGETTFLLFHLRMSGRVEILTRPQSPEKHDRFHFTLNDGRVIQFRDPRKFGRVYVVSDPEEVCRHLGPEPLEREFSLSYFQQALVRRKTRIKPLLLNQSVVAGLGNIYVDEALWAARVHPLRMASSLNTDEVRRLHRKIKKVIREAIDKKGTDFGDGVVPGGMFSPRVYGRASAPCDHCGSPIEKIVVTQRGTHFCPVCQTLNPCEAG